MSSQPTQEQMQAAMELMYAEMSRIKVKQEQQEQGERLSQRHIDAFFKREPTGAGSSTGANVAIGPTGNGTTVLSADQVQQVPRPSRCRDKA